MPGPLDLIVPNNVEFNVKYPLLTFDPGTEKAFVEYGTALADQCVFWSSADRVLVLPAGYSEPWLDDVHRGLGQDTPPVVRPAARTGRLISDLLHDERALAALRGALAGREVRLLTWGAAPEVYALAAAVRSWGAAVRLDVAEQEDYWSSHYLEAKLSCVDLAARVPGLRVPRGLTVTNWPQLQGALSAVLRSHGRAVVKSMYGVGGDGSTVVRSEHGGAAKFWQAVSREPFFGTFPVCVQEYIEHEGGCPAVDMLIGDRGVERAVASVLAVDGLRYRSLRVGPGVLDAGTERRLLTTGRHIAAVAQELGFRGWLGVDCIAGTDGELYVTEVNARRTGAMHAIALLDDAPGKDLAGYSHDMLPLRIGTAPSYERHVRPVFEELWRRGVRAYPSTVRNLGRPRPSFGIVVLATTAEEAELIAETAHRAVDDALARDGRAAAHPATATTGGRT
ncbi:ATP-grasp domain-containing protein [Streptomyces sp. NPDC026206]|uniref:ATP-grasp domain-containing protein n=1 Tax=Streptomyces sp. NPDC026206 TaxID=3157089 RepID=UPI0034084823